MIDRAFFGALCLILVLPSLVYSESVISLNKKGVDFYNQENYVQAAKLFELAYEKDPEDTLVKDNLISAYSMAGVQYFENEEIEKAITAFEKVLEFDSSDMAILANLAACYFKKAELAHKRGEIDNTIHFIQKGLEYEPTNEVQKKYLSVLLYQEGTKLYSSHEYEKAASLLKESLRYNEGNGYTYEVLGDIAYYSQDLDEAKEFWVKAADFEDSTRLRQKLEKLEAEYNIDSNLRSYASQYFDLYYAKSNQTYSGYKIREILRRAYRVVGNDFNYYPKRKIVVLVYQQDEFRDAVGGPHWVTAVYDGKLRLPQEDINVSDEMLKSLVWHEYTHAIVHDLAGRNCPTWLNEGLAQYQENKITKIEVNELKKLIKAGYEFGLEKDLAKINPRDLSDRDVQLFYQKAFTLVKYMIDRYRLYKVKEILEYLKEGIEFDAALNKAVFISVERLDEDWNKFLRKMV